MRLLVRNRMAVVLATVALAAACGGGSSPGTGAAGNALGGATASVANAAAPSGDSFPRGNAAGNKGNPPPSLAAVGEYGENLYDAVTAGRWAAARAIMDSLDRSTTGLPDDARIRSERTELRRVADSLRAAVERRTQPAARALSNRITYLAARMTAPYGPPTPPEVTLLDYYGRELQIWSADSARLARTAREIRSTWDAVRSTVERHGGAAAAAVMERYVTQVATARSSAAYARVADSLLAQVDELEKVFAKR